MGLLDTKGNYPQRKKTKKQLQDENYLLRYQLLSLAGLLEALFTDIEEWLDADDRYMAEASKFLDWQNDIKTKRRWRETQRRVRKIYEGIKENGKL